MRAAVLSLLLVLGGLAGPGGPLDCPSPCTIEAVQTGYLPPVAKVASGSVVRWVTSEESHPTANSPTDPCFRVAVGRGVPPTDVRFEVVGEELRATAGGTPKPCHNAVALGDAEFALPFQCMLHPWMAGALVVSRG